MSTLEGETVFGHLQGRFILGQTTLPLTASASLQHTLPLQECMKLGNKNKICFHTLLLMSLISLLRECFLILCCLSPHGDPNFSWPHNRKD